MQRARSTRWEIQHGRSTVPLSASLLDAELLSNTITTLLKRCAELETARIPTLLLLDADQLAEEAQAELLGMLSIHELGLRTLARRSAR